MNLNKPDRLDNPHQIDHNFKLRTFLSNNILWLSLLGCIGACIYLRYDAQVFPSASINLKLPRAEIIHKARHLASNLGYDKFTAIESTQFSVDDEAKTFLEYELGIDRANQLMKEDLPIWSWRTRFCKQYEQEEFRIWLSPTGSLQAFIHEIENDRKLPSLAKEEAQKIACQFIKEKTSLSLASYTLIKSASYNQSHRTDYSFTWEDSSRDFNGAKLRIHISIVGNLIGRYNYFLYVPESFERKFSTLRSSNEDLQSIASIFYSLLQVISVFIFIWAVSTKRIRWRFAIFVASIAVLVDSVDSFNDIASAIDSYNTEKLFSGYLFEFIVQIFVSSITKFISYLMLAGAAELIYRICYPKKVACENLLSPQVFRSKSFIDGSLLGHILVGINLGWIIVYYLAGKWWHIWCPSGIDNYQVLSSLFPFFSAIATGIGAAINEEFLYRVIALGLFQRLTRSFWLANIFQAVAWGFMHSTYPQEPAYARGVELTIIGLIFGWIIRRYGLWPCLVGHYLFDALLSVKPLFGSDDFWLKISAFVPVIPFLLPLLIAYKKARTLGYTDEKSLQNRSLIKNSPSSTANILKQLKDELKYGILDAACILKNMPALSKKHMLFLMLSIIISIIFTLPLMNYQAVNKKAKIDLGAEEVIKLAKQELIHQQVNPSQFKIVTSLSDQTDPLDMQYIFEQRGLKDVLTLANETEQGLYWRVHFFKPLDPKEYDVWINKAGKVAAFSLVEPEDTPGANLSEEMARKKAESYLNAQHPEWCPYKFENSLNSKRKARTDYTFVFTVPTLAVKDAQFKVSVAVLGDIISGFESGYDLPDHWLNEHNKRTMKDEIFLQIRTAFNIFALIAALIWAFTLLKAGQIKWQSAYFSALFFIGLSLVQFINDYPQFYHLYITTQPLYSYVLQQVTTYIQSIQSNFLYYFCAFALAIAAFHTLVKEYKLRSFISFLVVPSDKNTEHVKASLWLKSWLIAASVVFVHSLINMLSDFFHSRVSPGCPQESLSSICALANVASPMLLLFTDALSASFNQLIYVAIFSGLYKRYCPNFPAYIIFIVIFNIVTYSSARYWQDYLVDIVSYSTWEICMWYFIVRIIGVNPLAYFLIGFMDSLLTNLIDLIEHACPLYTSSIILAGLLFIAPLLYGLYLQYLLRPIKIASVDRSN